MKRKEYVSIVERHIGRPLDADETSFVHDTWIANGGIYASRKNAIETADGLIDSPRTAARRTWSPTPLSSTPRQPVARPVSIPQRTSGERQ